jgi:hypothetical protein
VLGLVPLPLNKELNLIVAGVTHLAFDGAVRDNLLDNKNVKSLTLFFSHSSPI